jgi:hypothetical protein
MWDMNTIVAMTRVVASLASRVDPGPIWLSDDLQLGKRGEFCFCRHELVMDERGLQLYLDGVNQWQTTD